MTCDTEFTSQSLFTQDDSTVLIELHEQKLTMLESA